MLAMSYCNKCGKPLRLGDEKFCSECGSQVTVPTPPPAGTASSSVLSNPKFLVLIACFVLVVIAFNTLHLFSAFLAFVLIVIAGCAIFLRGFKFKYKLMGLGGEILVVLISNGIEGWQENRQLRLQELAFAQLSPQEHLDKARTLLDVSAPQASIDEGLRHLNAIGSSAPEFDKAQHLLHQFEAAQRKRNEEKELADKQSETSTENKEQERCTTSDVDAKIAAEMVLADWKRGVSGSHYWASGWEKKRLFAVRDYDFLESYYIIDKHRADGQKPNASSYKFRVESATEGGFQITKDWMLAVKKMEDGCKVYDIYAAD
jgi:hypothetical protein